MRPPKADIEAAIREAGGNLSAAARALGCSRPTLYSWLWRYGDPLPRLAGLVRPDVVKRAAPVNGSAPAQLTAKIPPALHKWARMHAIDTDRTVSVVVTEAIELLRSVVEAPEELGERGGRAPGRSFVSSRR